MATYSFFDHGTAPSLSVSDAADSPVTLGFMWTTNVVGHITSVWVYVANTNLGGASGSALIYQGAGFASPSQPQLSRTDFTFQSSVGWQEIVLDTPVAANASDQFIAAVFFNTSGHYCSIDHYYDTEHTSGVLKAYQGTPSGSYDVGNGRFAAGSSPAYPQAKSSTEQSYLIDVTFDDTASGGGGSGVSVAVSADNTTPNTGDTVTLTATPSGGSNYAYQWSVLFGTGTLGGATSATATFTPSAPGKAILQCAVSATGGNATGYITLDVSSPTSTTTGHFTAGATDTLSAQAAGSATLQVQRGGLPTRQQRSLYGHRLSFGDAVTNTIPVIDTVADNPVTFALRTYLLRDCMLTRIRFLKAPLATGDHVVAVWQFGNQTPLATKTVTLTADNGGWVDVELDAPIALTASQTVPYLIGYFTPSGDYMRAQWVYGSQITVEYPFQIGVNGGGFGQVDGTGVAYGSTLTLPTVTWQGHSYFIDPVVEWQSDATVYTGGLEYYKQFSAYSDIDHFPIAIWQPQPTSIAGIAALGINTIVTFGGDRDALMTAAVAHNMDVFPQLDPGDLATFDFFEANPTYNARVKGYLIRDEPDMVAPWTSPTDLQNWYAQIRARDSTKLLMFNLGKNVVVNKGFASLPVGATVPQWNDYWRQFAHLTDIVSCDFYMEDSNNYQGTFGLWCNPRMVQRLQDLSDNSRPVWLDISTTAPPDVLPTPATVYKSIWAALIGGARGLLLFDTQFTSDNGGSWITDFAMANNSAMAAMIQALIARIQSLKDALLGPEAELDVSIDSSNKTAGPVGGYFGVPIHYTARQAGGNTYLFTQSIRPGSTTGTFTVPAAANKTITVIDESRTISVNGSGVFTDSFAGDYIVHLYQWS